MSLQLVCINYGSFADAVKAVSYCMNIFPKLKHPTILHPDPIDLDDIKCIKAMSPTQNECCLYEMPDYIICDHALGIQWDGFIVNPQLWTDEFLEYDLVAPPWPLINIVNPNHRVGSGGFVLFSKRMCKIWGQLCDPHPAPNDWNMGALHRDRFEAVGMKYAPLELAAKFGMEIPCDDLNVKEGETFGFHGFQYNPEKREQYRKLVYG